LLVVMLASFPLAWFYLLPTAFVEFAQSMLSSLGFGSNFFIHSVTAAYGAESSLLKPLLHTWSLSVEEQFYLLFPLFVVGARFVFRKWLFVFFLVLGVLSLLFAETLTTTDPDLSFYLLPTRAWQLLLGTMLAPQAELRFGRAQPRVQPVRGSRIRTSTADRRRYESGLHWIPALRFTSAGMT
jgi:peptidoglycan/LPS O-acetylase OafA/YrhL